MNGKTNRCVCLLQRRFKMRKRGLRNWRALILGIILFLFAIPNIAFASTWDIQTVDSEGDVGVYTSIALDSNNYPHISYSDNTNSNLKYAKWNGTSWNVQTVDSAGNVGWHTSIALDNNNYPHISYYDDYPNTPKAILNYRCQFKPSEENAEFIAHAPEDIGALLKEIKQLKEALRAVAKALVSIARYEDGDNDR